MFDGTYKSLKPLLDGTVGDTIKVLENGDIEVYRPLKMSL